MAVAAPTAPAALSAARRREVLRRPADPRRRSTSSSAAGARVGLIGANGAGKSTLLRMLAGDEHARRRRGHAAPRRASSRYLLQLVAGDERTRAPVARRRAARRSPRSRPSWRASRPSSPTPRWPPTSTAWRRVLERQARARSSGARRRHASSGDAIRHLRDLGLADDDLDRPTRALSGGQRKLVALAACLVQAPDVLLLDEPEAHLDVARRRDRRGARPATSRARCSSSPTTATCSTRRSSQIAELEHGRIRMWPGDYSAYAVAREVELVRRQQQYVTQQKEIARLEEAIRRFKDWAHRVVDERHIKRARNKQRRIDRMEKVERPVFERRKMALALRSAARGGDRVIELRGVDFDPVLHRRRARRSCAASASASSGPTAPARPCSRGCSPATCSRPRASAGPGRRSRVDYVTPGGRASCPATARRSTSCAPRGRSSEGEAVALLVRFLFDYEQLRRPIAIDERRRAHAPALPACSCSRAANCLDPRRADQPPRHPGRRDARGGARELRRDGHRRQPRPLLPRAHRRPRARGRRRARQRER